MLNRTLALFLSSVSVYGVYVIEGHRPINLNTLQELNQHYNQAELFAQEAPNNVPPHRGSGRCDQSC